MPEKDRIIGCPKCKEKFAFGKLKERKGEKGLRIKKVIRGGQQRQEYYFDIKFPIAIRCKKCGTLIPISPYFERAVMMNLFLKKGFPIVLKDKEKEIAALKAIEARLKEKFKDKPEEECKKIIRKAKAAHKLLREKSRSSDSKRLKEYENKCQKIIREFIENNQEDLTSLFDLLFYK